MKFRPTRASDSPHSLHVELEEEDVAVLDYVLFAFGAQEAGFFYGLFAAEAEEVFAGVAVGFDEAAFEVGVDDAGGAGGFGAAFDGPGADLLDAGGEVGDEAEEAVGGVDEAVEAGFGEAGGFEELGALGGFELRDFGFHGAADADDFALLFGCAGFDEFRELVAVSDAGFIYVGDVELRLHGDEEEVAGDELFGVVELGGAGGLAGVQDLEELLDGGELGLGGCGCGVGLGGFFGLVEALLYGVEIGEQELGVDDVDVVEGVDAAGYMDDFGIGEAADDVEDGVGLADVREELVAEAFALAGAFDDAGDVDELHGGGVGLDHGDDAVHAVVGYGHDADVGIDGAKRVVRGLGFRSRKRVEDGGLSDVRQPDNSAVQRHVAGFLFMFYWNMLGTVASNRAVNRESLFKHLILYADRNRQFRGDGGGWRAIACSTGRAACSPAFGRD